jgi:hypothetical protein
MRHEYQWRAYYENDSGRLAPTLDEYCAAPCVNGNHSGAHAFACIDQSRLIGLAWLAADGSIRTQVPIKPGAKAILFRRHKIEARHHARQSGRCDGRSERPRLRWSPPPSQLTV